MKQIDNIIKRLKESRPVHPDELKIVGRLLEEMRRQEKHENELITVQMSPEMYKFFWQKAYNQDENINAGTSRPAGHNKAESIRVVKYQNVK